MWQKCSSGQNKTDATCASDGSTAEMNNGSAVNYCKNLVLAGHNDWELPGIRSLNTIIDYDKNSGTGPYIDAIFKGTRNNCYWSNTKSVPWDGDNDVSWIFSTGYGRAANYRNRYDCSVRCVRSPSSNSSSP